MHDGKENCTFAFEIHTRNVAYNKILERQSTEVTNNKEPFRNGFSLQ